ncbi:right origin-binding protein [Klebsiella michiganensis]|nr:right origin-binding protein [Klebsiella michiganensis]
MNTGAFIHDLLDWIDNKLDSRLDIGTVARASRLFEMASAAAI